MALFLTLLAQTVCVAAASQLSGSFLHITDIHIDPHFVSGSDVDQQCHLRQPGSKRTIRNPSASGPFGAPGQGCDSPLLLVNETFRFVRETLAGSGGVDFVVWTGDNARHDSDAVPRTQSEIFNLNRILTDHVLAAFGRRSHGVVRTKVPVLASIGNNDVHPHNRLKYSKSSRNPTLNFFADLWAPFIPPSQDATFRRIGCYVVDLVPNKLWGVSLNTLYLASSNDAVPDCRRRKQKKLSANSPLFGAEDPLSIFATTPGDDVLKWLEMDVLIPARNKKVSVYISGHIPPNVVNYGTGCYTRFSHLTIKYRDVIRGQFYGHMNIDHFFFSTPDQVLRRNKYDPGALVMQTQDTMPSLVNPSSLLSQMDDEQMHTAAPSWVSLYFEYLILHFKVVQKSEIVPFPILVAPSVVPAFNPALRVYSFNTNTSDASKTTNAFSKNHNPFGTLLDYKQFYANLEYWNALARNKNISIVNDSFVVVQSNNDTFSMRNRPKVPKYIYELEYTPRSTYDMIGNSLDTNVWLDFGERLSGQHSDKFDSVFNNNHVNIDKKKRHKKKNKKDRKKTHELRDLFYTNMVVHLQDAQSHFSEE